MHIDLAGDMRRTMPVVDNAWDVGSLRVWNCRYTTLRPLEDYPNLRTLVISGYPDDSLEPLGDLRHLRYLSIVGINRISDLAPLAHLPALETLQLEAPKPAGALSIEVVSFDPLGACAALRHVSIYGIRPVDKSLRPLERCPDLVVARFDALPEAEISRFYAVRGKLDGRIPPPRFEDEAATRLA